MRKQRPTHGFISQIFVFTLVAFGFSGSIGLGTVWMRHQNALAANTNKTLERRIAELERRLASTSTDVAREQTLGSLDQRNKLWRLGLVPPGDRQVQRVTDDPVRRLASKRNRELFQTGVPAVRLELPRFAQN